MLLAPLKHDPNWKNLFHAFRIDLNATTGIDHKHIEHIGSTSIVGLSAKPVIDIQIGVENLSDFDLQLVAKAGFSPDPNITKDDPFRSVHSSESDWKKKYARRNHGDVRVAHLHIRQIGKANHRFALLFRDFLRTDQETCQLYSDFKIAAAKLAGATSEQGGTGSYLDLKDPFVKLVACRAEDWASKVGWRPGTP